MDSLIVGLTGPMGAGKSVVANILSSLSGWERVTLSMYVKQVAEARNIPITRDNLQQLGRELRDNEGMGVLAVRALSDIEQRQLPGVIIDGIRSTGEVDVLESTDRSFLIGIDAPVDVRYRRHKSRGYLLADSFEQFQAEDTREMCNEEMGFNIGSCLERARSDPRAFIINNDRDFDWLSQQVKKVWSIINKINVETEAP